jgi:hypothetical protein
LLKTLKVPLTRTPPQPPSIRAIDSQNYVLSIPHTSLISVRDVVSGVSPSPPTSEGGSNYALPTARPTGEWGLQGKLGFYFDHPIADFNQFIGFFFLVKVK